MIIGEDPVLRDVMARAGLVAPTRTPVLVWGESGTGKELLARLIHDRSSASGGPFVAVNCGALPRELAESELFGHERGAFTGATGRRVGWFEEASGGTLVLDEIGELSLDLQPKLLRVLETGRLRRVGGSGEARVEVRVVAMTLRDLRAEAAAGSFRLDLYHRLAGFELHLPPLRDRRGDVPFLARHFVRELAVELGPRELERDALQALCEHDWPGNVRELRNTIRRAAILTGSRIDRTALERAGMVAAGSAAVTCARLPPASRAADQESGWSGNVRVGDREDVNTLALSGRTFAELERAILGWALRRHGGSRRQAARALGVSRSTFCDKVRRYGIA